MIRTHPHRPRIRTRRAALIALGAGVGYVAVRRIVSGVAEKALLTTLPNGPETPADVGLDAERFTVQSGGRELAAWFVRPDAGRDSGAAVLIFHGTHEAISQWVPAQQLLAEHGIASMVFDYSGYGDSAGTPTIPHLREDVQAAYRAFKLRTGPLSRRFLMGYSLGTGCLLDGIPGFDGRFDGVILLAPFTSARQASVARGSLPAPLAVFLPDVFNNVRAVSHVRTPLLIVHSADDERLPLPMAERVLAAANEPKRLVVLHGLRHSALVHGHAAEYLSPAIAFIDGSGDAG